MENITLKIKTNTYTHINRCTRTKTHIQTKNRLTKGERKRLKEKESERAKNK